MIYIKSLAAGLIAVAIAAVVLPFVMILGMIVYQMVYKPKGEEALGWDIVSFAKTALAWTIAATVFLAAFIWEFRRAR